MKILITGGVGFIGCNAVKYFSQKGHDVYVIDNLSRETSVKNLAWLRFEKIFFNFAQFDIRDHVGIENYFKQNNFDVVIHLAAQVAVTTSVIDPKTDFDINAQGTFNILESLRKYGPSTIFINASTNKVYGKISDVKIKETETKYEFIDSGFKGISEHQNLDFYSPYGCSKGIADQYTLDYSRIYGLRTVSVRQSCIYGPHQFGIEDQGWVAWFIIAYLTGHPITIYGNGKQVRDILYVDDLVEFYDLLISKIDIVKGSAFNMGGGISNSLSLLEYFNVLQKISSQKIGYSFSDWRPGDQAIFISDNSFATQKTGFSPKTSCVDGISKIYNWLLLNLPSSGLNSQNRRNIQVM